MTRRVVPPPPKNSHCNKANITEQHGTASINLKPNDRTKNLRKTDFEKQKIENFHYSSYNNEQKAFFRAL